MIKEIKGEKYIYLLMAYERAKADKGDYTSVGNDNGMVGGQNYWRAFSITEYQGRTILTEKKSSKSCADFSRSFEVVENKSRPSIYPYINEAGEDCSARWVH
jgi:hypothetical protein